MSTTTGSPSGTSLTNASQSTTSTPTTTSSQSDSDTATLYLFTFLATILILVLLSASLVLRSYILRRRYRQRFQRALADNTFFAELERSAFNVESRFDPLGLRPSARRVGPKPVLWDSWIHPVDEDTWSSFTPVAVRCTRSSPPSTSVSSPQPSTTPSAPMSSPQRHPSLFSQLRFPSPFSLSRSSSPGQPPTRSCARSPPPPAPTSSNSTTRTDKDAATLAVCVLVAMPDVSAPVHRPVPDAKGKGVDPLESQAPQQSGDADPLLPSSLHRSGTRIPDPALDEDGLPLLELGVIEIKTGEWAWKS